MSLSFKPVKPLLQSGSGALSRWFSFIGLGLGVFLLLCAIQMFVNIQQLLKGKTIRKNGFDYIAVTKKVTNENMGQNEKTLFSKADIEELKSKPFVDDVAPLVATNFRLEFSGGTVLPFKTDMFLESIRSDFIDTVPPDFDWHEGQNTIPIIVSSDFLEVFNAFAPAYGYPKISRETASGIPVLITCYGTDEKSEIFNGKIIAFTDRINSTLVPLSFIDWANLKFSGKKVEQYSRIYLKTKDANNTQLLNFLDQKNYEINKDKTRFGRVKQILQGIFTGLGIFGLMIVVLALMLFSFYLQLVIAKSKENLQLLLAIGYSPKWLGRKIVRQLIPVYFLIIFIALLATQFAQWSFYHFIMSDRPELSVAINGIIFLTAIVLLFISVFINYRLVKKLLLKI